MNTYPLHSTTRLVAPFLALLLIPSLPTNAGDVLLYALRKGQLYVQSTVDAPELAPENPYIFEAFVEGTGEGEIESVNLTKPGTSSFPSALPGSGFFFSTRVVFSSLNAMNSLYRSGTFRFQFYTENDIYSEGYLDLSGDTYPPTPHVVNYTAAQAVNPAANFAVQWDPFTGGTGDDIVELYVYDETDSVVYQDTGLDGTARSDTIPANTLVAGKTYSAEVIFWRSVDFVFDNSGAFGFSFYYKTTRFNLATTGSSGNNPAPTMSSPVVLPAGQFQFHIDGVAGRLYRIESTADFGSWDPVETITAPAGGSIDYAHNPPPGLSRFYRAVLLP